jgi:hypothetical protein
MFFTSTELVSTAFAAVLYCSHNKVVDRELEQSISTEAIKEMFCIAQ